MVQSSLAHWGHANIDEGPGRVIQNISVTLKFGCFKRNHVFPFHSNVVSYSSISVTFGFTSYEEVVCVNVQMIASEPNSTKIAPVLLKYIYIYI